MRVVTIDVSIAAVTAVEPLKLPPVIPVPKVSVAAVVLPLVSIPSIATSVHLPTLLL